MSKNLLKDKLFDRVKRYNIDEKELNKIFKKVFKMTTDETELNKLFDIETEKYMIKQIKKGETRYKEEIKNANQYLKVMIQRDDKHKVNEKVIDKLYENAIEVAIDEYNDNQLFSILIFKYMKSLSKIYKFESTTIKDNIPYSSKKVENNKKIIKTSNKKTIDNKTLSKEIVDSKDNLIDEFGRINANFLMLLILNGKMNKADLMDELKISYNMLLPVLNGKSSITEYNLKSLYKKFKATDVYDLKRKIAIACGYDVSNMHIQKIEVKIEKENEKVEIKTETLNVLKEDKEIVSQEKTIEEKTTKLSKENVEEDIAIQHQIKEKNLDDNVSLNKNEISNNNIFDLIKNDVLNNLILDLFRNKEFTEKEYVVACLLFKGNNGKYYSKEEISRFLDVDENTINKIYLDCLTKYRDYYNNLLNNINKLKLENEEN